MTGAVAGFSPSEIDELKVLAPGVEAFADSGTTVFVLPKLRLPAHCDPQQSEVLLWPAAREGYPSRLYFADQIKSSKKTPNWTGAAWIIERNWQVFSWKPPAVSLRLVQMIASHLEAFG